MKNSKLSVVLILASTLLFLVPTAGASEKKTLTIASGTVDFLAVGKPSFLKVKGQGATPTGTLSIVDGKASGEFTVDLSKFTTGIDTRDDHMKNKYLEVEKHPLAKIRFSAVPLKTTTGAPPEFGKSSVTAELELHGQKHPVTLEAELKDGAAKGKFKIKLSQFGIAIPTYAGITVADDVDVTIDSVLK